MAVYSAVALSGAIGSLPVEPDEPKVDPIFEARTAALANFLNEKQSPMPAAVLLQYPNWPMIVALSAAESGYGSHLAGAYNGWGIKDFRYSSKNFRGYRDFESWEDAIGYTSALLYKYDTEDGSPEPREMVLRWKAVGPFGAWLGNVHYALDDLQTNVIVPTTPPTEQGS